MKKTSNPNIFVGKQYSYPFSYREKGYKSNGVDRWYIEGYMLYQGLFITFTIYDNVGFGPKPCLWIFAVIGDKSYSKQVDKVKKYSEIGMRQVCRNFAAEVYKVMFE